MYHCSTFFIPSFKILFLYGIDRDEHPIYNLSQRHVCFDWTFNSTLLVQRWVNALAILFSASRINCGQVAVQDWSATAHNDKRNAIRRGFHSACEGLIPFYCVHYKYILSSKPPSISISILVMKRRFNAINSIYCFARLVDYLDGSYYTLVESKIVTSFTV